MEIEELRHLENQVNEEKWKALWDEFRKLNQELKLLREEIMQIKTKALFSRNSEKP